eukprot:Rhum_TRINITY_DN14526_c0_g4::Rhum_TRINITY_DN14526_c0_g4_i1::g.95055::m.95055
MLLRGVDVQEGQKERQRNHHHAVQRLVDLLLPVVVVRAQSLGFPGVRVRHDALNLPQQRRDACVLLGQLLHLLVPVHLQRLRQVVEVQQPLRARRAELLRVHQPRGGDLVHHLRNVRRVLVDLLRHCVELADRAQRLVDVLLDAEGVPVQRLPPRLDGCLKLGNVVAEDGPFGRLDDGQRLVVLREHRLQVLDKVVVLLVEKRYAQRDSRDVVAQAVQVLRFLDDLEQVVVEVHKVPGPVRGLLPPEDVRLQVVDCVGVDVLLPLLVQVHAILLHQLRYLHVRLPDVLPLGRGEDAFLRQELLDRLLDPLKQALGPVDRARHWRLVLRQRGSSVVVAEDVLHVLHLVLVAVEDALALLQQQVAQVPFAVGHVAARRQRLERLQQLEGGLRAPQLLERGLDELPRVCVHLVHVSLEAVELRRPRRLRAFVEDVERHSLNGLLQVLHLLHHLVDAHRVLRHRLQLAAQDGVVVLQRRDDLEQLHTPHRHVVRRPEQTLLVELPPCVALCLLDVLPRLLVRFLPLLQHRLPFEDLTLRVVETLAVAADGQDRGLPRRALDVDVPRHLFGDGVCNLLEQAHHLLVGVVVPRNRPHHADRRHHRRQRVDDRLQRLPGGDVRHRSEVAFECGQELDVVLRLVVHLRKVVVRDLKVRVRRADVALLEHLQHRLHVRQVQLLVDGRQDRVLVLPKLDFGERVFAGGGVVLLLRLDDQRDVRVPLEDVVVDLGQQVVVLLRLLDVRLRVADVDVRRDAQLPVAAHLVDHRVDVLRQPQDRRLDVVLQLHLQLRHLLALEGVAAARERAVPRHLHQVAAFTEADARVHVAVDVLDARLVLLPVLPHLERACVHVQLHLDHLALHHTLPRRLRLLAASRQHAVPRAHPHLLPVALVQGSPVLPGVLLAHAKVQRRPTFAAQRPLVPPAREGDVAHRPRRRALRTRLEQGSLRAVVGQLDDGRVRVLVEGKVRGCRGHHAVGPTLQQLLLRAGAAGGGVDGGQEDGEHEVLHGLEARAVQHAVLHGRVKLVRLLVLQPLVHGLYEVHAAHRLAQRQVRRQTVQHEAQLGGGRSVVRVGAVVAGVAAFNVEQAHRAAIVDVSVSLAEQDELALGLAVVQASLHCCAVHLAKTPSHLLVEPVHTRVHFKEIMAKIMLVQARREGGGLSYSGVAFSPRSPVLGGILFGTSMKYRYCS